MTIQSDLYRWLGHMRDCDNRQSAMQERCRLTHDQAMRLCFELSMHLDTFSAEQLTANSGLALAAYSAGRPWDLLAGAHLHAWLVPYEPKVVTARQRPLLAVGDRIRITVRGVYKPG